MTLHVTGMAKFQIGNGNKNTISPDDVKISEEYGTLAGPKYVIVTYVVNDDAQIEWKVSQEDSSKPIIVSHNYIGIDEKINFHDDFNFVFMNNNVSERHLKSVLEDTPPQKPGLNFGIQDGKVVSRILPEGDDGNDYAVLDLLHQNISSELKTFVESYQSLHNRFPALLQNMQDYLEEIDRPIKDVEFTRLYAIGLRLQSLHATALKFQDDLTGESPNLSRDEYGDTDSILLLHKTFISMTTVGQTLLGAEARYNRSINEEEQLLSDERRLIRELKSRPDVIETEPIEFIEQLHNVDPGDPTAARQVGAARQGLRNIFITCAAAAAATASGTAAILLVAGTTGTALGMFVFAVTYTAGEYVLKKSAETLLDEEISKIGHISEFFVKMRDNFRPIAKEAGIITWQNNILKAVAETSRNEQAITSYMVDEKSNTDIADAWLERQLKLTNGSAGLVELEEMFWKENGRAFADFFQNALKGVSLTTYIEKFTQKYVLISTGVEQIVWQTSKLREGNQNTTVKILSEHLTKYMLDNYQKYGVPKKSQDFKFDEVVKNFETSYPLIYELICDQHSFKNFISKYTPFEVVKRRTILRNNLSQNYSYIRLKRAR